MFILPSKQRHLSFLVWIEWAKKLLFSQWITAQKHGKRFSFRLIIMQLMINECCYLISHFRGVCLRICRKSFNILLKTWIFCCLIHQHNPSTCLESKRILRTRKVFPIPTCCCTYRAGDRNVFAQNLWIYIMKFV